MRCWLAYNDATRGFTIPNVSIYSIYYNQLRSMSRLCCVEASPTRVYPVSLRQARGEAMRLVLLRACRSRASKDHAARILVAGDQKTAPKKNLESFG
jgi:hypothetical protein